MTPTGIKNFFLYSVGHTYSNLSRLFLRVFTGVMFLQFGLRQIMHYETITSSFPGFGGLSPEVSIAVIVSLELICATCIIFGLFTRIALIPSLALMCYVEFLLFTPGIDPSSQLFIFSPGYPIMFIGVFCFMLLAGPGKISVDYIIAVHLDRNKEDDEVLENA